MTVITSFGLHIFQAMDLFWENEYQKNQNIQLYEKGRTTQKEYKMCRIEIKTIGGI